MIALIIKSYFTIILSVGIAALTVFIVGLIFILRSFKFSSQKPVRPQHVMAEMAKPIDKMAVKPNVTIITSKDISAIAGDDILATQLDLARAYIEAGKKSLAKKILESVVKQGTAIQQEEANSLLGLI